jgi:hypothetical protein
MEFFTLWPGRGHQGILRGPFPTAEKAAKARTLNGDIVVIRDGFMTIQKAVIGTEGKVLVGEVRIPQYVSYIGERWLWDWEDAETSSLAFNCQQTPSIFGLAGR